MANVHEVEKIYDGAVLGLAACHERRKIAGTSSWPSWISHFTGSFVGHSPSEMLRPPADWKGTKEEVLHQFRCSTHTMFSTCKHCAACTLRGKHIAQHTFIKRLKYSNMGSVDSRSTEVFRLLASSQSINGKVWLVNHAPHKLIQRWVWC